MSKVLSARALLVLFLFSTILNAGWFSWEDEGKQEEKKSEKPVATKKQSSNKETAPKTLDYESIKERNPQGVYVGDNYQIFVPKEEFYLYLSLTDDSKSEKILLSKNREKSGEPRGIKLGKPGLHKISHAFNANFPNSDGMLPADDPSKEMTLIWDDEAPTVKLFEEKSGKEVKNGAGNYYSGLSDFTIKTYDDYSGTKAVYMNLDGSGEKIVKENDRIKGLIEGSHAVELYSVDYVGNVSELIKKEFFIDSTPPKSYVQLHTSVKKKDGTLVVGPDSALSMSADDELSGVGKIMYKVAGSNYKEYSKPISLRGLKNGKYTLSYFSKDSVNNKESIKTLDFTMDDNPPVTVIETEGDIFDKNGNSFLSDRTRLKLASSDFSGVKKSYLFLDGKEAEYKNDFFVKDLTEGKKEKRVDVGYYSVDRVGNVEKEKKKRYSLDTVAPEVDLKLENVKHILKKRGIYIKGAAKVYLTGKDMGSGVKSLMYSIDGGEVKKYQDYIDLSPYQKEPFLHIDYYGVDNVNNISKTKTAKFFLDREPPKIYHHFSYNGKIAENLSAGGVVTNPIYTKLYIAAQDQLAGVESIYYKINSGEYTIYKAPVKLSKEGEYNIEIKAVDRLGNEGVIRSKIKIVPLKTKSLNYMDN